MPNQQQQQQSSGGPAGGVSSRPAGIGAGPPRGAGAGRGGRAPLGELDAILGDLPGPARDDGLLSRGPRLYDELEALARYIERAKREVRAIRCDDIATRHIPLASGELDAIGSHLEEATGVILDACEGLEAAGRGAGGEAEAAIAGAVTRIYEACSFQDITGQRITKVVKTLKHIEERVTRLLDAFGQELAEVHQPPQGSATPDKADSSDKALLNGPQLSGRGVDQAEIDRLLASFD